MKNQSTAPLVFHIHDWTGIENTFHESSANYNYSFNEFTRTKPYALLEANESATEIRLWHPFAQLNSASPAAKIQS